MGTKTKEKYVFISKMVSFAEDDWFRGLICSMVALGCILCGYAIYYRVLEPRWPDPWVDEVYDDEDEDEDEQLAKTNDGFIEDSHEKIDETKLDEKSPEDDNEEAEL